MAASGWEGLMSRPEYGPFAEPPPTQDVESPAPPPSLQRPVHVFPPIAEEGATVLIRAKVARSNEEIVLVCIEHCWDDGRPTPFSLVVGKASIAAVEVS